MVNSVVHHIALYVDDIHEKIRLFQEAFNMKITEIDGDISNPKQVWLDGGIQLIARADQGCSLAHVALTANRDSSCRHECLRLGAQSMDKGEQWLEFEDGLVIELIYQDE